MILVAGGTGVLGSEIVKLLVDRGLRTRVLTRDSERATPLQHPLVQPVKGDVTDAGSIEKAMEGVTSVVSAVHGFAGTKGQSPRTIDAEGNSRLIRAAKRAGAQHFILMSVVDASPDHPMELMRMKYAAEQELRSSGLAWTIIRPAAFMETWCRVLCEPVLKNGKSLVFGGGNNPINFVSTHDVARYVEQAVIDPSMRSVVVEVGGPENLTMRQFVETFARATGRPAVTRAVPLPVMRALAPILLLLHPMVGRQIQAGVVMDTHNMSFDPAEILSRYPSIPLTHLDAVVRRDYA